VGRQHQLFLAGKVVTYQSNRNSSFCTDALNGASGMTKPGNATHRRFDNSLAAHFGIYSSSALLDLWLAGLTAHTSTCVVRDMNQISVTSNKMESRNIDRPPMGYKALIWMSTHRPLQAVSAAAQVQPSSGLNTAF